MIETEIKRSNRWNYDGKIKKVRTKVAIKKGEGLCTHSTPCDAMVQVLDGEADINIGSKEIVVRTGEVTVMPADVPHPPNANQGAI